MAVLLARQIVSAAHYASDRAGACDADPYSWYDLAMAHAKVSVTLDSKVAAELRTVVGPRGVSAFVNEAVRRQLQARRVQRLLDEMADEYGPIDDEVVREVEAITRPGQGSAADS